MLPNGTTTSCKWYQFRIPIREYNQLVGKLNGFQSIRFMRMFLNDFEEPIILRFATLELVYATWRKYTENLLQPGDYPTGTASGTSFSIGTVNIEENGSRFPVPYVLPPDIEREEWYSTSSVAIKLNEQALALDISNLASGDARAVYRSTQYDLRNYGKLKMFVHAEKKDLTAPIDDEDLVLFSLHLFFYHNVGDTLSALVGIVASVDDTHLFNVLGVVFNHIKVGGDNLGFFRRWRRGFLFLGIEDFHINLRLGGTGVHHLLLLVVRLDVESHQCGSQNDHQSDFQIQSSAFFEVCLRSFLCFHIIEF
jgi:hypothetical protein